MRLILKILKRFSCCLMIRPQLRWIGMLSSTVLVVLVIASMKITRHYPSREHPHLTSIKIFHDKPYTAPSNQSYSTRDISKVSTRLEPPFPLNPSDNRSIEVLLKLGVVEKASDKMPPDTKIILWSVPTRYYPKLSNLHPLRTCPEMHCRLTTNRYFQNKSDAVVFAVQLMPTDPPKKLPNQVWILHNHESPRWDKAIRNRLFIYRGQWKSKFNWTIDYREDADLNAPYGVFKKIENTFEQRVPPVVKNYTEILRRKFSKPNATVAWMVSHCESPGKRHKYVSELSKYIKVDIFGRCGTHHCPRSDDDKCFDYLSTHYKFYLSFENAFCKDYITEKMFRFYKSDMVMVVRGGGNYSRVTPPNTYINTADFHSPKHLAEFLQQLNGKDKAFLNILKEKDKYEPLFEEWPTVRDGKVVFMNYRYEAAPMCQLCDRLHNLDKFKNHYEDIKSWFKKGVCYSPTDI